MASKLKPAQVCRQIVKEIYRREQTNAKVSRKDFIMDLYKSNKTTSARYCREQFAANHDAMTYWCLLRSIREYDKLCDEYHSSAEQSIKSAANTVGLDLPKNYEDENNGNNS